MRNKEGEKEGRREGRNKGGKEERSEGNKAVHVLFHLIQIKL